jgi:hypothetical protein
MASTPTVCVIGAGPSGITAAKNCLQGGLDVVVFEQGDRVGGNWVFREEPGHSSVYATTHIITSRRLSAYEDFPMPADWPDYPSHRLLQQYFESYARHFGVLPAIRFRHTVTLAEPTPDGRWRVSYTDDAGAAHARSFDYLMVASGHHWDPALPQIPGAFAGRMFHSHAFKRVDDSYRGKRVLVIGAGNSACDIAVESARVAERVCLSMRGGQWFVPKFMFGVPTDVFAQRFAWLPPWLFRFLNTQTLYLYQGRPRAYGLPEPRVPLFSQHITINSELLYYIRHGEIHPRPGVACFDGDDVIFADGRREPFDLVIAATGYRVSFPFFDEGLVNFRDAVRIPLFKKMIPADLPGLYFIGLFQPLGCIWPLADYQARLAVREIRGEYRRPADLRAAIQWELDHPHYPFEPSPRHAVEVDYHRFRRELLAELRRGTADAPPPRWRLPFRGAGGSVAGRRR